MPVLLRNASPEHGDTGHRDRREYEVGAQQRPAAEEARARPERVADEAVHRSCVAELARQPDEPVGDERDADRREDERERRGAPEQLGRLDAR